MICLLIKVGIRNGDLLQSTTRFEGTQKDAVIKSGPVRCSAVDRDFSRLVTTGDDKKLKVWEVETFKLLSERYVPFHSLFKSKVAELDPYSSTVYGR